jgi:hypothetical protein
MESPRQTAEGNLTQGTDSKGSAKMGVELEFPHVTPAITDANGFHPLLIDEVLVQCEPALTVKADASHWQVAKVMDKDASNLEIEVPASSVHGVPLTDEGWKELKRGASAALDLVRAGFSKGIGSMEMEKIITYFANQHQLACKGPADLKRVQTMGPRSTTPIRQELPPGMPAHLMSKAKAAAPMVARGVLISNTLLPGVELQATVGVHMGALPEFLKRLAGLTGDVEISKSLVFAKNAVEVLRKNGLSGAKIERLQGLAALVHLYLAGAAQKKGGLVKNITPVMARTNFATIYGMLAPETKAYFQKNAGAWTELFAGVRKNLDEGMFPVYTETDVPDDMKRLSVRKWLEGFAEGEDHLTNLALATKMGGYGNKVDAPDTPIFELRNLRVHGLDTFEKLMKEKDGVLDRLVKPVFDLVKDVNDQAGRAGL